jgi:hypothetical protein
MGALAGMEFQKYRAKAWHLLVKLKGSTRMIDFTKA